MKQVLKSLKIKSINNGLSTGIESWAGSGKVLSSYSPVDGHLIGKVRQANREDYDKVIESAKAAFKVWRNIPAPKRGEIVRQMGDALRENKNALGRLVSYEMGKSLQEGWGEVQEMIDICDFAVGLSRQLYGLTMHSERPQHRMYEQWHPIGIVGIITAFNFPVAVWSWNTMLAWICGDVCVWKPSEKTPLTAIACQNIIQDVLRKNDIPEGVSSIIVGDRKVGEWLSNDTNVALVSATGSTRMGKAVGQAVAARFGKSLLELGGNNAIIVTQNADLDVVIPAVVFGAVGTAGQRCTTTRRLFLHESIFEEVKGRLVKAYSQLRIGNPLDVHNHVGPLIDLDAVNNYQTAINNIVNEGGKVLCGNEILSGTGYESGCYVKPTIVEVESQSPTVCHETFAPILYIKKFSTLDDAIELQNAVPQGLSSSIFTLNMREAEQFLSCTGSDCGIANVNIGTSGAEIGGAFGGEKETGGGRESGSDAWKNYMRRQTNTINYSSQLPLAQGIKFDL
ncbi:Aldehyde Dehydrogenase [Emticicia oligotrophica DSM 17448]|uniref:aldehyde dehydrogenase (NAD(+)) n=1 Tax=Emticicia oligotrophica (strain DSM 17448 / CIP 109782 / MTCC 6937 / GPTSA100-15) TaxID=929562 RepID=A0ABN4AQL3_EMTOG|nr:MULTISPECIES: aldehyde dehydrogenase family protein [Emticicia]AFK04777.1 Aldehyde Dehydrogenase [Emticicia oligotrophica DSM 17448]